MPSKQVEDAYNARRAEEKRQSVSPKVAGYTEGVVHGWEAAAVAVAEATNGLFTLQEPPQIAAYRERLKRYK